MRKMGLVVALSAIALLTPVCASANPYIPSLVEIITAPRAEAGELFFWVAVPAVFLFSLIETLVVRWKVKDRSFIRIWMTILIANFLTSVLGYYLIPSYSPVWPMVACAFGAAVLFEWLVVLVLRGFGKRSITGYLGLSLRMNCASYALISLLLACMLYGPTIGHEQRDVLDELNGRLVLSQDKAIDLHRRPFVISTARHAGRRSVFKEAQAAFGKEKLAAVSADGKLVCCQLGSEWYVYELPSKRRVCWVPRYVHGLDSVENVEFSRDNRFVAYTRSLSDVFMLLDLKTGSALRIAGLPCWFCFSPNGCKIAWTKGFEGDPRVHIYDCRSHKDTHFTVPWTKSGAGYEWSPDGKFLAYETLGPSEWTRDRRSLSIRVVSADGERSATILRGVATDDGVWYWAE